MESMKLSTCHFCGVQFRRDDQYEFFCTNICRGKQSVALGITLQDATEEKMDDLAIVMYEEYLNEINQNA